jgi:hypothetical protein
MLAVRYESTAVVWRRPVNVGYWHSSVVRCTATAHPLSGDELTVSGHGCDSRSDLLLNSSTLFASKKFAQWSVTETTWVDIRCLDRTPPGGSQA